jgi:replicative DNA helicase
VNNPPTGANGPPENAPRPVQDTGASTNEHESIQVESSARDLLVRGFSPIPVPHKEKAPALLGWQALRLGPNDLPRHFNGVPANVGVLLGEPSGWIVDVDLDHARAVELADTFLPNTGMIWGRESKPRSHRLYRLTRPADTRKWKSKTAGMIVELRSTGCQTIAPGSTHPTGEAVRWDDGGEPAAIDPAELIAALDALAAAVKKELGEPPDPASDPSPSRPKGPNGPKTCGHRYAQAALDGEAAAVRCAPEGTRNDTLNTAAFSLGTLVGAGALDREIVAGALREAARASGTPEPEAAATIASGLSAGEAQPRDLSGNGVVEGPAAGGPGLAWPDAPIPLGDAKAPPTFPMDALLPEPARAFVAAVAASKEVPADFPALALLGLAGGCIAYAMPELVVEAGPGWMEQPTLYVGVALPSGSRKSQTLADLLTPILQYEREVTERTAPTVAAAKAEREIREKRLKQLQERAAKDDDPNLMEQARTLAAELAAKRVPMVPRLVGDDTTPETLGTLLAQQGGRLILASAECDLIGILRGRYSEKGGANLGPFLKGHSGDLLIVDRRDRQERIERPMLSLVLSFQNDALAEMLGDKTLNFRGMNGRWLFAVPASLLGFRPLADLAVPTEVRRGYHEMMGAMLRRAESPPEPPQWNSGGDSGGCGGETAGRPSRVIHLTRDAMDALKVFRVMVEKSMRPGEELAHVSGWASKLPGAVVRIGAIMALMGDPERTTVDLDHIDAAIKIGEWAMDHALHAFALAGADPDLECAKLVLGWLQRKRPQRFSKREAWQGCKGSGHATIKRAADLDGALVVLQDHGHIMAMDPVERAGGRPGRSPSQSYAVHPSLCEET